MSCDRRRDVFCVRLNKSSNIPYAKRHFGKESFNEIHVGIGTQRYQITKYHKILIMISHLDIPSADDLFAPKMPRSASVFMASQFSDAQQVTETSPTGSQPALC